MLWLMHLHVKYCGGKKKKKKSGCLEVQNEKKGLKSVSRKTISVGVDTHMLGNE